MLGILFSVKYSVNILFTNLFSKKVTLFKKAFFCDLRLKFKKRLKKLKKGKKRRYS